MIYSDAYVVLVSKVCKPKLYEDAREAYSVYAMGIKAENAEKDSSWSVESSQQKCHGPGRRLLRGLI